MENVVQNHLVITGASSGLGAALARCSAAAGDRLTLLGRDRARLEEVGAACRLLGASVETITCDVRDAAGMRAALQAADDRCAVDILIANAGIGGSEVLSEGVAEAPELAHAIIEINFLGTINTIGPLQERFAARREGTIVLMSSLAAYEGLADAPSYAASKAAVRIYGHGLRRRLAVCGVNVTVVSPGFVDTPMSQSLPFVPTFSWSAEKAARRILLGVSRNEPEIAFPWQLTFGLALSHLLPVSLVDLLMATARSRVRTR